MKRSPIKRSTPLRAYARLTSRTPIRRVSPKRQRALTGKDGYWNFSKSLRAEIGKCQIEAPGCTGRPDGVHHVIKRSHGGALVPGAKADVQGQVFMVACNPCNGWIEDNPREATRNGWVKRNLPGTSSL